MTSLTLAGACGAPVSAGGTDDSGTPVDADAGILAPVDGGAMVDAPAEAVDASDVAPLDAWTPFDCGSCAPAAECEVLVCDGACTYAAESDGTVCSESAICVARECRARGCGDGWREPGPDPAREGCDDGNTIDGDACAADCTATVLAISDPTAPDDRGTPGRAGAAVSGSGRVLFVWTTEVPASGGAKASLSVVARRANAGGAPIDPEPFVLETGIPIGQEPRPTVAGLASGWAVAWRRQGELGDIALTIVGEDASLRPLVASSDRAYEQRDPTIASLSDGFVVAWASTATSAASSGIRARVFDGTGAPRGPVIVIAAETLAGQPRLAGHEDDWGVAWTSSSGTASLVRLRRSHGSTALDPTSLVISDAAGGANPALAAHAGGYTMAWQATSATERHVVFARAITASGELGSVERLGVAVAGTWIAAARLPSQSIIGYAPTRDETVVMSLDAAGLPLDWQAVALSLAEGASDVAFSPSARGVWVTWTSATPAGPDSFAGRLVPWS